MPKQLPDCPARPVFQTTATRKEYVFTVITPLFGGGAEARTNGTPEHLIRGSSVRGHLRFWWRALRGNTLASHALKTREESIWGSSETPSPVKIEIEIKQAGNEIRDFTQTHKNQYPAYALFPFQRNQQMPVAACREKVQFLLKIEYPPALEQEIQASLWAWTILGGIGARTRRGLGSLYCQAFSPQIKGQKIGEKQEALKAWYTQKLAHYGIQHQDQSGYILKDHPIIPVQIFTDGIVQSHISCWKSCIDLLAKFRQGENVGRNPSNGKSPGRSRWPEADSIRRLTGMSAPNHQNPTTLAVPEHFPRANFGLPIQFRFNTKTSPGDPPTYLLEPDRPNHENDGRMASPLLLKPLAISPTESIGLACNLLVRWSGLRLKLTPVGHDGKSFTALKGNLFEQQLQTYRNSPYLLAAENFRSQASNAFIDYFQKRGLRQ